MSIGYRSAIDRVSVGYQVPFTDLMIRLIDRRINHGMILVKLMIIAMTRMLNQYEYDIVDLRAESWIWTVLPGQVCTLYINIYHIYHIIYLY